MSSAASFGDGLGGEYLVVAMLVGAALALAALAAWLVRLSQHQRRRLRELEALGELNRAMLGTRLDLGAMAELLRHCCHKIVPHTTFALQLTDEHDVPVPVFIPDGEPALIGPVDLQSGALQWMERERRPLRVDDWAQERVPFEPLPTGRPTRSALYLPIVNGERFLGVISLQSATPGAFARPQQEALTLLASQAALGLYMAAAYRREQQRAAQLTMIAEVSRRVTAILDLPTLFADTVRLVQETLGYYHVSIYTVDAPGQEIVMQASTNPQLGRRGIVVPWGQGLIGHAAAANQRILAGDVRHDSRFREHVALDRTRSEFAIPLQVDRRILGILDLQSDHVNAFSDQDAATLQILADQVAVALEDNHIYAAQQEQAWVATALLQVAEAVAQHSTSEEIIAIVVRLTQILTGVDRSLVFLWSPEAQAYTVVGSCGLSQVQAEAVDGQPFSDLDLPLLARIRRQGEAIEGDSAELVDAMPPPFADDPRRGTLLALPLRSKGQVTGILAVEDLHGEPLTSARRTILTGIAHQTTVALENAQLTNAQREEAWVSTALLQVADVIGNATYDLGHTLETVVRLTAMLVGIDWCAILLWQDERHCFEGLHTYGLAPLAATALDEIWHEPENLAAVLPLLNGDGPAPLPGRLAALMRPTGVQAPLAIPLRAHDRLLGMMLAGPPGHGHGLTPRQANILAGVAHQSALAIETDQLYQQTVRQERLQHEIDLARAIQESFLPEHCPEIPGWGLAVEWRAARGVGGDYYDFIRLAPDRLAVVIADVSDKGVAAALYMALSRTVMRATALDAQGPADTLRRANRILMQDSRSGMFVSLFYGIIDLASGSLTYARAGHNPPLLVRAAGATEGGPCMVALDAPGIVLGVIENADIGERTVQMEPGDTLVLYTDGVVEAIDGNACEFGEARLQALAAQAPGGSAQSVVQAISEAVRAYSGDNVLFDDLTLMVVRRD